MIRLTLVGLVLTSIVLASGARAGTATRDLEILGWVEKAHLPDVGITLKAKLDSGAETSSLDANVIKKFRQDGKRWVRFVLTDRETGEEHTLVKERTRTVSIVQHDGSRQSRPVVEVPVCIAGRTITAEFSLIDRGEFIYPMLLGRRALKSFALIDPGNTFLSEADCD